jgi:dicarboxylate transporter 10
MNVSQLAAYAESKRILLDMRELKLQDDTTTHILASLAAGTVATTVCAPADVLKSRLQSMPVGDAAQRPTLLRYIAEAVRKEGMRFFVKGWLPAWCRLAPNTVLTFVFMEKLKSVMHHEVNLSRASMLERA